MERRFQVDKDFERQNKNFMIEYESLGHMIPVENNVKSMDSKIYFLPHHAVMKGDSVSTKLRVVFDGTFKPSNGNSLNSILGIGKMLQPDLFTILVKFRLNEIAFSADIQQMYRQILIDQEDQNFQRIVWRKSKDFPIREYKLCTVTYGTASAPYLATRCLFQTGLDLERDDPVVSSLIKESFYIDDLMKGAPSSEEAISLIKTLSSILEARGFHLRKWRSNSSEVLSRISSNWVGDNSNLEIHPDECSKALGLTWNSMKDIFIFNLKDSPLSEALATKWKTFQKEFEQGCSIHIPRWIHTASQQITLHGFCDASELAYASVIYAVQSQADGNTKVTLLVAKSRVAPTFWRKWKIDYLSNLQNRTKWKSPNNNFKVGEIVIIKEDNIPPATWPLGKSGETHPGKDGVVRVVTLKLLKVDLKDQFISFVNFLYIKNNFLMGGSMLGFMYAPRWRYLNYKVCTIVYAGEEKKNDWKEAVRAIRSMLAILLYMMFYDNVKTRN
ncbi:DUF1758 domain-containing protein [Trichonephila clavipes]|nr:DUF1758 domain-containing protein [Trichonephila clavipes]